MGTMSNKPRAKVQPPEELLPESSSDSDESESYEDSDSDILREKKKALQRAHMHGSGKSLT